MNGSLSAHNVLALQRTAGNQRVQRMLAVARQSPPAPPAPPAAPADSKLKKLDEMLDRFNVPEGEVIDLLSQMSDPEKQAVLGGGYKAKLAGALNVGEMVRAVNHLGPPLAVKLEWVAEAAGGAKGIDYSDIRKMIQDAPEDQRRALKTGWRDFFVAVCDNAAMKDAVVDLLLDLATKLDWMAAEMSVSWSDIEKLVKDTTQQDQKDALKTTPWRDYFVGACTNSTMRDAVIALGFDLKTQLAWMIEEGTNLEYVTDVIKRAPASQYPPVVLDDALLRALRGELGEKDYTVAFKLMSEMTVTNTTDTGNQYKALLALSRSGLTVSKDVNFIQQGTFAAGGFAALKARVLSAVTSYLSGKFKVSVQSVGTPREGDGLYPITVVVRDVPGSDYPLRLHGGTQGRSGVSQTGGDIYERGQGSETSVPDVTLAHESAHMMLGASDEYANASVPGRVITNDNSLMGNFYVQGMAAAHVKARHFQQVANHLAQWFPGRTITIVP